MKPIALRGTGGRPSSTGRSAEQSLPGPGTQDVTWPSPPSGTQTPRAHRLSSICFSVRTPCSPVATSVCTSQRCVATPLYTHPVVLSLCPVPTSYTSAPLESPDSQVPGILRSS